MGSRFISRCGVQRLASKTVAVAMLVTTVACGSSVRASPSAEEATTLVIPPLGADAGMRITESPSEPVTVRTALTLRVRDPRIAKRQPRSRALVLSDVQQLERLLATTSSATPDRPT